MKKKYNKPLTAITMVRNEMGFCSSVMTPTNQKIHVTSSAQEYQSFDGDEGFVTEEGSETIWK